MAGLYSVGDPNTEGVKTRKICPVPHPLTGLWILGEDRITWQKFFGTVYPATVNEAREATYLSLTQFMQQLAVRDPAMINCANRPAAPPRNTVLSYRYLSALENHFAGLQQDAAAQQHSQISGALGRMADEK